MESVCAYIRFAGFSDHDFRLGSRLQRAWSNIKRMRGWKIRDFYMETAEGRVQDENEIEKLIENVKDENCTGSMCTLPKIATPIVQISYSLRERGIRFVYEFERLKNRGVNSGKFPDFL